MLKLAKSLAAVALGMILLHAMPAVCDESNQINLGFGMTSSDGCVAGDACCASPTYITSAPDFGLGAPDLLSNGAVVRLSASSFHVDDSFVQVQSHRKLNLSTLGKLNI